MCIFCCCCFCYFTACSHIHHQHYFNTVPCYIFLLFMHIRVSVIHVHVSVIHDWPPFDGARLRDSQLAGQIHGHDPRPLLWDPGTRLGCTLPTTVLWPSSLQLAGKLTRPVSGTACMQYWRHSLQLTAEYSSPCCSWLLPRSSQAPARGIRSAVT